MTHQDPSKLAIIGMMLYAFVAQSTKAVVLFLRNPYASSRHRRQAEEVKQAWVSKMHIFTQKVIEAEPRNLEMNLHMMLVQNDVPGYDSDVLEEWLEIKDAANTMRELRSDMVKEHRYLAALFVAPTVWIADLQKYATQNKLTRNYANTQLPVG